eukprot:357076-Chlamydomonas_euryale.AAC.3
MSRMRFLSSPSPPDPTTSVPPGLQLRPSCCAAHTLCGRPPYLHGRVSGWLRAPAAATLF